MNRCSWPSDDALMIQYHDNEWGVPVYDDQKWFEFLVLDAFQAGLSWKTILHKRENFRKAFNDFNFEIIVDYRSDKIELLMNDAGIIRNRLKIESTISNAKAFINIREEFGSFNTYIWSFVDRKPLINHWKSMSEIPVKTELSDKISKDLKQRGFKFVGSTIVYAFLQAAGVINDHTIDCFRHSQI
ncbi:MAG: DNA-3-methyladenine glycosylase I [Bacteroidales bacterium]|jgi:DNA-3-methyladenine glycosylase I|nr:DNA-3-methyladenine glycosylase I [Bacteroidales bacterium]